MIEKTDRDPVEALAEEFLARHRGGEKPSAQEYADQHPQWAGEIHELFPTLLLMEKLCEPGSQSRGVRVKNPFDQFPANFGDYQVLRVVGRGGMGVVFEAVHQSLDRHVALKVLPSSPGERANDRERFRLEARAAAQLHHTNVVPVFDVGEIDGIPYYAMQFIDGVALDEIIRGRRGNLGSNSLQGSHESFASMQNKKAEGFNSDTKRMQADETGKNNLDKSERSSKVDNAASRENPSSESLDQSIEFNPDDLFAGNQQAYFAAVAKIGIQVADALQFIDQGRLVHRDIKPSNLILDRNGRVWVTDFGLAKFYGDDDLTANGGIVGTMRYMAPERFQNRATHHSDIYGLGASLYELLTLTPMFDQQDRVKLMEQIINEEPVTPRKLNAAIPVDLETIIKKMIEKRPDRRYECAADVATDLRRWLNRLPIRARRISPIGHVVRWAQRKPMVASLLAGITVITAMAFALIFQQWRNAQWQRQRAEKNLEKSQQVVRDFQIRVAEGWGSLHSTPGSQQLRRELLLDAREYFQQFVDDNPTSATTYQLAYAHFCLGDLAIELGEMDQAELHHQRALKLIKQIDPRSKKTQTEYLRAQVLFGLANVQANNDNRGKSLEYLESAQSIFEQLAADDPKTIKYQVGLASTLAMSGVAFHQKGEFKTARSRFNEAILLQKSICDQTDSTTALRTRARTLKQYGDLLRELGEIDQSINVYQDSQSMHEQIENEIGPVDWNQLDIGACCESLGSVYRHQLDYKNSIDIYNKGIESLRSASARNPRAPFYRSQLADLISNAGNVLAETGDMDGARKRFNESLQLRQNLVDQFPDMLQFKSKLANSLHNMGIADRKMGAYPVAVKRIGNAVALLEQLQENAPQDRGYLQRLAISTMELGVTLNEANHLGPAIESLTKAKQLHQELNSQDMDTNASENQLARILLELALARAKRYQLSHRTQFPTDATEPKLCHGLIDRAEKIARRLVEIEPNEVEYQRTIAMVHYDRSMLINASRQFEKAADECQKAIVVLRALCESHRHVTRDTATLGDRLTYLAGIYSRMKEADQCFKTSLEAIELKRQLLADFPGIAYHARSMGHTCFNLAMLQTHLDEKNRFYMEASDAFETIGLDERSERDWEMLASSYQRLAYSLVDDETIDQAIEYWEQSVNARKRLVESGTTERREYSLAMAHAGLGQALQKREDIERARQQYQMALSINEALVRQNPDSYSFHLTALNVRFELAALEAQSGQTMFAIRRLELVQLDLQALIQKYPDITSGKKLLERCETLQLELSEKD